MKQREKILAGIVLGFVGLFVVGVGLTRFFSGPLREIDKQTAALKEKLAKINQERREYFDAEDGLKRVAQRTFATDVNQASARSGEIITRQIAAAGLSESDFTRLPVGPRRLKGASEIGWSIQGKGDLARIVNLLFLLQTSPHVHRLEGLTLSAYEKPGEIKVRFLFLTLVLEPSPDFDPIEVKPKLTLESPERFAYNTILERDILRPYIKAAPRVTDPTPATDGSTPATNPLGLLRVVSLSDWDGHPEVHIRDSASNKTLRFQPGDKFNTNIQVVAIDYRPLPLARNPALLSHSRVVLKLDSTFWAVERGQTLAEMRKLTEREWPVP